jgi:hypothetical protein
LKSKLQECGGAEETARKNSLAKRIAGQGYAPAHG